MLDQFSPGQGKCKQCRRKHRSENGMNNTQDYSQRKVYKESLKLERSKIIPSGHTMCSNCYTYFITDGYACCEKCYKRREKKSRIKDLSGLQIGALTAQSFIKMRAGQAIWKWSCQCGSIKEASKAAIQALQEPANCGCVKRAEIKAKRDNPDYMHTYTIWSGMKQRCTNPNTRSYHRYGGRGIKVCDRWQKFEFFLMDMGYCPLGFQIDRIDNDGDYEPGNCQWIVFSEHSRKTSLSQPRDSEGRRYIAYNSKN